MTDIKHMWIGSIGPLMFDQDEQVTDPDLDYDGVAAPDQAGLATSGQLRVVQAPTAAEHVLRQDDLGTLVGDVVGPASSTDEAVARFDGTTGKKLQNSLVVIDDSGNITGVVDLTATGDLELSTGKALIVNSIQVVSDQEAAVADATGAGDVVAQLNALLARLRSHGLIAT